MEIPDFACIEINFDLVALLYMVRCIFTFKEGKPNIESISIKDPGKGLGNDA